MPKPQDAARQREKDRLQASQHYLHWGVKTVIGLVLAVLGGLAWLVWVMLSR